MTCKKGFAVVVSYFENNTFLEVEKIFVSENAKFDAENLAFDLGKDSKYYDYTVVEVDIEISE